MNLGLVSMNCLEGEKLDLDGIIMQDNRLNSRSVCSPLHGRSPNSVGHKSSLCVIGQIEGLDILISAISSPSELCQTMPANT